MDGLAVGHAPHIGFAVSGGGDVAVHRVELQLLRGGVEILQLFRPEPRAEVGAEAGEVVRGRGAHDDVRQIRLLRAAAEAERQNDGQEAAESHVTMFSRTGRR